MSSRSFKAGLAVTSLLAAGLSVGLAGTAQADPSFAPSATDYVGVGSDTTQIVMADLATAYNASASGPKIASFDACVVAGTTCTPGGNITIRPSTTIVRPNGSGAGKALLYGAGNNTDVTFARSSAGLSTAETAAGLLAYPYAVDSLVTVVSNTVATNAPAALSINQVLGIYNGTFTNWSQLGGNPGVIKPYVPQTGSGTRSFFLAQLQAANNGVAPTLASTVTETQEHDPTAIKSDPNAIAPFSLGRIDSSIRQENGWLTQRAVYNVVRGDAAADVKTLFGTSGFLCSAAATSTIEADGFKQMKSGVDGSCGVAGSTSDFRVNNPAVAPGASTTSVAVSPSVRAYGSPASAVVTVGGAGATGFVTITGRGFSGVAAVSGGQAVIPIPANLPAGTYPVSASYSGNSTLYGSAGAGTLVVSRAGSGVTAAYKAKVKKGKRLTGSVTVSAAGVTPTGAVTITVKGKVVGSGNLSGGSTSIKLAKLKKKGKNTLTVSYSGDANVSPSSTTVVIKRK